MSMSAERQKRKNSKRCHVQTAKPSSPTTAQPTDQAGNPTSVSAVLRSASTISLRGSPASSCMTGSASYSAAGKFSWVLRPRRSSAARS